MKQRLLLHISNKGLSFFLNRQVCVDLAARMTEGFGKLVFFSMR